LEAPTTFTERLHEAFDGRLRIRWSVHEQQFLIEQKVGRAVVAPIRIDEDRDDLIRARDGYHPVMVITPGDRMRCPKCHYEMRVPVRDTHDLKCQFCALSGRPTRVVAGYWPLDDSLIEHLRKIDPLRDGQDELAAEADAHNRRLIQAAENAASREGYAALDERYNRMVGIPQVGYTGKEFRGHQAA
jgi:hypothetical protein